MACAVFAELGMGINPYSSPSLFVDVGFSPTITPLFLGLFTVIVFGITYHYLFFFIVIHKDMQKNRLLLLQFFIYPLLTPIASQPATAIQRTAGCLVAWRGCEPAEQSGCALLRKNAKKCDSFLMCSFCTGWSWADCQICPFGQASSDWSRATLHRTDMSI